MKEYRKTVACWFLVTWRDDQVHSYTCVTLLFVPKTHKTRLAVNHFVCNRRQVVSKLGKNIERPLNITLKVVKANYNELFHFKVKLLICGYGCGKFNYLGGFLRP